MEQGQGNREDGVRPGSQGPRGFPWSPSLCGVPRCREGGVVAKRTAHSPFAWIETWLGVATRTNRLPYRGMTGIATLSFLKVGATSPSRWSIGGSKGPHCQFCRLEGAPIERDRHCTIKQKAWTSSGSGQFFWSRYFFTSRQPHLPSAPLHWKYPFLIGGHQEIEIRPPVLHL